MYVITLTGHPADPTPVVHRDDQDIVASTQSPYRGGPWEDKDEAIAVARSISLDGVIEIEPDEWVSPRAHRCNWTAAQWAEHRRLEAERAEVIRAQEAFRARWADLGLHEVAGVRIPSPTAPTGSRYALRGLEGTIDQRRSSAQHPLQWQAHHRDGRHSPLCATPEKAWAQLPDVGDRPAKAEMDS